MASHPDPDDRLGKLLEFVRLVATPHRADGTYNYCREALEQRATQLLADIGEYPPKAITSRELAMPKWAQDSVDRAFREGRNK